jgi:serine protease AprX
MATRRKKETAPPSSQKLDRKLLEQLIFGTGRVRRFTQDSPVLPDVWIEYAKGSEDRAARLTTPSPPTAPDDPFPPVKLLLTPYRENSAGDVRRELRKRLQDERGTAEWRAFGHAPKPMPRVAYNQTTVAATLHFEDLIRVVLPMTDWWARLDRQWKIAGVEDREVQEELARAVEDPEHPPSIRTGKGDSLRLPPALLWMVRVAGTLALYHRSRALPETFLGKRGVADATLADWEAVTAAVAEAIRGIVPYEGKARIYSISLNREVSPTISRSTLAIKADAARLLFNIACGDLAWAIVDSGVDASHPSFRRRSVDGVAAPHPFADEKGEPCNQTRVVATYDFTQIDLLLDPDTDEQPTMVQEHLDQGTKIEETLADLNSAMLNGRTLDWKMIGPLLSVPHEKGKYKVPGIDHGTHVAGILASDWRREESNGVLEEDLSGVCPDLRLYDFRVLDADGRGDEFTVMAALQFLRYLNSTNDYTVVHGANLSLSIPHDISNYACGRTPVCDECERAVHAGVVVVAAAGNQGYRKYTTEEGTTEAYNSISITDPGNAELVITVGATHRFRPHTYGVSYFSSRGPTGDGRSKPDLVAPGEKITAPLPNELYGLKDGTSMAAPHVSGAAALLMARYNELVGQPERIKQILCDTATDLGREKYFQGAGMLDVLRALQSV